MSTEGGSQKTGEWWEEIKAPQIKTATSFDVEKFDGRKVNFGMGQCQMRDILVQQGLHRALVGVLVKPTSWSDAD